MCTCMYMYINICTVYSDIEMHETLLMKALNFSSNCGCFIPALCAPETSLKYIFEMQTYDAIQWMNCTLCLNRNVGSRILVYRTKVLEIVRKWGISAKRWHLTNWWFHKHVSILVYEMSLVDMCYARKIKLLQSNLNKHSAKYSCKCSFTKQSTSRWRLFRYVIRNTLCDMYNFDNFEDSCTGYVIKHSHSNLFCEIHL